MVRYFMTFHIRDEQIDAAAKIINAYFDALEKGGPGGMRSQCYETDHHEHNYIHIKSFKKDAVARHHFKSGICKKYLQQLMQLCGQDLHFTKLYQQQTFESIY
ncbi:MAG: hypothetical protein R2796_10325 [Chitinophagaceae bacterium]|nr:hypothetical protein [Chitinophagaceae bacterium]